MGGNVSFKRLISMISLPVAVGVVLGACGSSSVHADHSSGHSEGGSGCRTYVRGVLRQILPESSDLSCSEIDDLINGIPSEPGVESIIGGSPRLLWKCRFYAAKEAPPLLLRCQHHDRRFSVVKRAN
jgi:hypothetical protein